MNNKKWTIWLTCALVAVLMVAGLGVIAAEYGSQSDPLVTLSYIEQVLLPQAKKDVDQQVEDSMEDFEDLLNAKNKDIQKYIDKKLRSFASGDVDEALVEEIAALILAEGEPSSVSNAPWAVITVPAGATVVCEPGVQAVLRSGQASSTAVLVDLSNGEDLTAGKALVPNHMYVTDAFGEGFFTAQGCTVLISGGYTVQ
ncbi:MAG: hypothetical protein IJN18_05295 [Clostridia bacterium]|nr:hypothetical protein [Clostridia bacterium]